MMKQDLSAISAIKVILSMKMYKHILNQHIEETGMIVSNVNIVQHTSIIWRGSPWVSWENWVSKETYSVNTWES